MSEFESFDPDYQGSAFFAVQRIHGAVEWGSDAAEGQLLFWLAEAWDRGRESGTEDNPYRTFRSRHAD